MGFWGFGVLGFWVWNNMSQTAYAQARKAYGGNSCVCIQRNVRPTLEQFTQQNRKDLIEYKKYIYLKSRHEHAALT